MTTYQADSRRTFNRRRMLGQTALAGFGATSLALVGCGGDDDDEPAATADPGSSNGDSTPASSPTESMQGPIRGGHVALPISGEPPDLDPSSTLAFGLHTNIAPVYSRLVRTVFPPEASGPADFTLMPDLAESWEQVDLQTYIFKLRPNATWHDVPPLNGRAVTADDIVFAYDHYRTEGVQASAFDVLENIEATDESTVRVTMSRPYALFFETVTNPVRHIFPREAVERSSGLKETPILGSGPFMFESFERGSGFSAVRNPNYFEEGWPYLDSYEIRFIPDAATRIASFRSGDLALLGLASFEAAEDVLGSNPDAVYLETVASHSVFSPAMNLNKPPFNDPRVRRAMSMATDRQGTVDALLSGHGITGWGVPWVFAQEEPWTEEQLGPWHRFDVAEAKSLLDAAGYEDGFSTTMNYFRYTEAMESEIQLFQASMKANLNIDIELGPLDYAGWFNNYTGMNWDGMAWGFQIGTSSGIDDFLYKNLRSDSPINYYYVADDEIDALADQIRAEADEEARKDLIRQVFDIDHDMMYRLHTPYSNGHAIAQPSFHGWQPSPQFRPISTYGSAALASAWVDA